MLNKHVYILIMAGGEGIRFAPLSTPEKPKQFHNIVGDRSLLRQTFERVKDWVPNDHICVSTNERFLNLVKQDIPEIPLSNIHLEPKKKNTAPCIAYVAAWVMARDPEGIMLVLPSDHMVLDKVKFQETIEFGVEVAAGEKALVTFGILPSWPSPDYGYIKRLKLVMGVSKPAYWVERFVEKPSEEVAVEYIESGLYYWNSGMFVWRAETALDAISRHLPKLYEEMTKLRFKGKDAPTSESIKTFFEAADAISIDYGVMERAENVITIPCSFGWSDIGTWSGLKLLVDQGDVAVDPLVYEIMERECGR